MRGSSEHILNMDKACFIKKVVIDMRESSETTKCMERVYYID